MKQTAEKEVFMSAGGWLDAEFERFQENLNGSSSSELSSLRKSSLEAFLSRGFPSTKDEDWKFTNPGFLQTKDLQFAPNVCRPEIAADIIEGFSTISDHSSRLVFVNGEFIANKSTLVASDGLTISSIEDVFSSQDSKLSEKFNSLVDAEQQPFAAMNSAFTSGAACIHLGSGVNIGKPIELLFIHDNSSADLVSFPRVLIVAEEKAKAEFVENCVSTSTKSSLSVPVVEIFCEAESEIGYYRFLEESEDSSHVSTILSHQKAKSTLKTFAGCFGSSFVRNEIYPVLAEDNAYTEMLGVVVGSGAQHIDNSTVLDHASPNCESTELYKGVYGDTSRGVFSGTIIVRPDAQKTNAIQSNESILLSDDAKVNSRPQLKIWADDVKCTHGATIGQLDDEALFYLRSRGIPKKDAQALLTTAFVSEISERIDIKEVAEKLIQKIQSSLEKLL